MAYGIFVFHLAGTYMPINSWVKDFDVNANGGRGNVSFTKSPSFAKKFASVGEAFSAYRMQSTLEPFRDDGLPNRPLTAYTVEIRKLLSGNPVPPEM
jgi:hypothetical protein